MGRSSFGSLFSGHVTSFYCGNNTCVQCIYQRSGEFDWPLHGMLYDNIRFPSVHLLCDNSIQHM